MEKREFFFRIYKDIDWEMREAIVDISDSKILNIDAFATIKAIDNKIVYLTDMDVKDEDLELVSKDERFLENCIFVQTTFENEPKIIKEFEGTFIDALNYIKEQMEEENEQ